MYKDKFVLILALGSVDIKDIFLSSFVYALIWAPVLTISLL
jgi:hypothetical protein